MTESGILSVFTKPVLVIISKCGWCWGGGGSNSLKTDNRCRGCVTRSSPPVCLLYIQLIAAQVNKEGEREREIS